MCDFRLYFKCYFIKNGGTLKNYFLHRDCTVYYSKIEILNNAELDSIPLKEVTSWEDSIKTGDTTSITEN